MFLSKFKFLGKLLRATLWLAPQVLFFPITVFVLKGLFGTPSDNTLGILSGALTASAAFSALAYTAAKADINDEYKKNYEQAGNYLFRAAVLFGVVLIFHFTALHKEMLAFSPDLLVAAYLFVGHSLAGAGFVWLHIALGYLSKALINSP